MGNIRLRRGLHDGCLAIVPISIIRRNQLNRAPTDFRGNDEMERCGAGALRGTYDRKLLCHFQHQERRVLLKSGPRWRRAVGGMRVSNHASCGAGFTAGLCTPGRRAGRLRLRRHRWGRSRYVDGRP